MARPSSALEPSYPPGGTVATLWCTSRGYNGRCRRRRRDQRPGDVLYRSCHCDPGTGPVDVWIARTHGVITRVWVSPDSCSTLPNRACAGWCIGLLRIPSSGRFPLKGVGPGWSPRYMDPLGFEPRASSLQRRHSTAELWARSPVRERREVVALVVLGCPVGRAGGGRASADVKVSQARRPGLGSVEVIQPQIPLRLPCYDLSPLAKPRFNRRGRLHPDLTRVL